MAEFADQVVFLTGAGGSIGRATALAFGRAGARVVVTDLSSDTAAETARQITASGGRASSQVLDVRDENAVARCVARVVEEHGRMDVAVNGAAVLPKPQSFLDIDLTSFRSLMDANVTGSWLCMREELRAMAAHGSGAIVNVASVAGLVGTPALSSYSASKHALIGLTRCAAREFGADGLRINAVCPGFVRTPFVEGYDSKGLRHALLRTPAGRLAEPEEVVSAILWLASPSASFVNGHALAVDGGLTAV